MDILGIDAAHRYVTRYINGAKMESTDMDIFIGDDRGWFTHERIGVIHFYIGDGATPNWYFEVRTARGWGGSTRYDGSSFEKAYPVGGMRPEYELGSASWSCDDAILLSLMVGLELDY